MSQIVYKLVTKDLWASAEKVGVFKGAPIDIADGFMHFSTSKQARETAQKYFAGREDVLLVEVSMSILSDHWQWDLSRGGDLFPHLYVDLPLDQVNWVKPLPLGLDGLHAFPELSS